MKVFAVCSLKGGVGKTSVVLGLVSSALARGLRTLVVDMDPQADATMALDVSAGPGRTDLAAALAEPGSPTITDAIEASGWDEDGDLLDVVVGSARSASLDGPDPAEAHLFALRDALAGLSDYDLVLIDCPPSLGGLTQVGLAAAQRAIIVTEPGLFAVAAAERALRVIHDLRSGHPELPLQPLGIIVNRVRTHTKEHSFRIAELSEMFGPLVLAPAVPERSAVQQAQGALRPIHTWPGASAADLSARFDQLLARALRAPGVDPDGPLPLPEPLPRPVEDDLAAQPG